MGHALPAAWSMRALVSGFALPAAAMRAVHSRSSELCEELHGQGYARKMCRGVLRLCFRISLCAPGELLSWGARTDGAMAQRTDEAR